MSEITWEGNAELPMFIEGQVAWEKLAASSGGGPWGYRKAITLSRASGAVTNYQMKLLVGESEGASGEDVDCGGKCNTDFSDLRFLDATGNVLDYWIESITGTTPNQLATVWIEFNSIGTSATTFYMLYGNAAATSVSNGANTFTFFDDFASFDNWDVFFTVASITGGIAQLSCDDNVTYHDVFIRTKSAWGGGNAVRARVKTSNYADADSGTEFMTWRDYDSFNELGIYPSHWEFAWSGKAMVYDGYAYMTALGTNWTAGAFHIVDLINAATNNNKVIVDGVAVVEDTEHSIGTGVKKILFDSRYGNVTPGQIDIDWVLVRQCLAVEPSWGSWGDEESEGYEGE